MSKSTQTHTKIELSRLKYNPKNPRKINDEKLKKLVKSIKEFPQMMEKRPIVCVTDAEDGLLVPLGGNMRLRALKELKLSEIPNSWVVLADDWTEEQRNEFIIKDNVAFGEWDAELLNMEFDAELLTDWGLDSMSFDLPEVLPLEAVEDNFEIQDDVHTDIVLGDLIEIGDHRLLCGDSTNVDDVYRLMNGRLADMVFTDPPYGINIVGDNGKIGGCGKAKNRVYRKIIADDTTDTAKEFYQTCVSFGMDKFIIWGGNYFTDFLPFSDGWLIWNKRANTGMRNNFADGEMAWCSFHTPVRIYDQLWNGMIREGEKEKRVHPTQKPIRMLSEIINDHIKGNLIYDGFLGSGSIMVACHQLNRKCYGMELDPKYCQVIIDRMLKLDPEIQIKINGEKYEKTV